MTTPVTEVTLVPILPDIDPDAVMVDAASTLLAQPGCQRVRWAKDHENPNTLYGFIDWDATASHELFMTTEAYVQFVQRLSSIVSGAPTVYHVAFEPFPPNVLSNLIRDGKEVGKGITMVAEVLHTYFPVLYNAKKQNKSVATLLQLMQRVVSRAEGATGETASGWVEEEIDYNGKKSKAYVMILGWESVDAYLAYRETDVFKDNISVIKGLEELKGFNTFYITSQVIESSR